MYYIQFRMLSGGYSGVVTTKTQSFLRSLTAREDLRAGATKYLKWNVIKKK